MKKKVCTSCKHENHVENYFCTECGSKLLGDNQDRSRLRILHGVPKGATFLLRKGRNSIGHDCGNLIVLGDEQISNKHAVIMFREDSYWIEDINSKNGVYVNGEKISKRGHLYDGSLIKLGTTILKFENNSHR